MRIGTGDEVRAAIARHVLGAAEQSPSGLGDIELHPHQRLGLGRIKRLLELHGGALLADEVGLGKTFVALGVARDFANTVVIAPSAIRDAWLAASRRARVAVRFVSVEALSRGPGPVVDADLVVIDEAHHFRTRGTNRFATASALCRASKVLLLSATPVQNTVRDLRAILSLFLGATAHAMPEEELAQYVVRRGVVDTEQAGVALPGVAAPLWLDPVADVDCLDRLLALPRAVPPADGDDGGVLLTYTLVRQWASSRAALRSALQRRLARACAIEDALLAGRLPSRAELSAWCFADGVQQLAFPELAASEVVPADVGIAELLARVQEHSDAVRELMAWLKSAADPDVARAEALREILRRHGPERVVAFSGYTDTIAALYDLLAPTERVAMLTHSGGRVAGGALSRREVLSRFAPGAALRARPSDRIDLLLTTDVLSEGVDMHDASIVVHLDLSWNPARLEQRVGRLRRLGATRDTIRVYLVSPPAPAERMLRLEQRLRLKLGTAARSVGVAGAILPGVAIDAGEATGPREERIAGMLRAWHRNDAQEGPVAATISSRMTGALACVRAGGKVSLLAVADGRVTDARAIVEDLLAAAGGEDRDSDPAEVRRVYESVETWLRRRFVSDVVNLPALRVARSRRALLHRVDTISRRAPRHAQPQLAPLMHAARAAATATLSSGAERVLDEITRSQLGDTAWLHAIGEFAALHARGLPNEAAHVLALLILRQP